MCAIELLMVILGSEERKFWAAPFGLFRKETTF
jgi:hypothetical protein